MAHFRFPLKVRKQHAVFGGSVSLFLTFNLLFILTAIRVPKVGIQLETQAQSWQLGKQAQLKCKTRNQVCQKYHTMMGAKSLTSLD